MECVASIPSDDSFVGLGSLRVLHIRPRSVDAITDAAFTHLTALEELKFSDAVSDRALEHLPALHTLELGDETRVRTGLRLLTNLTSLVVTCEDTTDDLFVGLSRLQKLNLAFHDAPIDFEHGLTDEAFRHMPALHTLQLCACDSLTDAAFAHLPALTSLSFFGMESQVTPASFKHTPRLQALTIGCDNPQLNAAACAQLGGLLSLSLVLTTQPEFTDVACAHLTALTSLKCTRIGGLQFQMPLTGAGLASLHSLEVLHGDDIVALTGDDIASLSSTLRRLRCRVQELPASAFERLSKLEDLVVWPGYVPYLSKLTVLQTLRCAPGMNELPRSLLVKLRNLREAV